MASAWLAARSAAYRRRGALSAALGGSWRHREWRHGGVAINASASAAKWHRGVLNGA